MYDRTFYERHVEGARRSARVVVPMVLGHLPHTQSAIDVGCGRGTWLSVIHAHGVPDVRGVDGDYVNRHDLEIPERCFSPLDLSRPFSLERRFDLVLCLEVAEHLPVTAADGLITSLTSLGPVVLFSAAIPCQGGEDHVNEQWPEYWTALFERRGYRAVDALRHRIWRNPDVEWWYAQNMMFYVDRSRLHDYPALEADAERQPSPPLSLVHPQKYLELLEWIRNRS